MFKKTNFNTPIITSTTTDSSK